MVRTTRECRAAAPMDAGTDRCRTCLTQAPSSGNVLASPICMEASMTTRPLIAMTAFVAALLFLAGGALAQDAAPKPTAKDAEAFIARVEAELLSLSEYSARVAWISNNFITDDTMWLQARVRADMSQLRVANAKQAAGFNGV